VFTHNQTSINGISIITTPRTAKAAIQFLEEEPLSYFFTSEQVDSYFNDPQPWQIVDMPGKDKGVVATRKIKQYETFMVDQASVLMDMAMEKKLSLKENLALLKVAVDRLRYPDFVRALSSKHNGHSHTAPSEDADSEEDKERELEKIDEDIMMTNAFGTQIGETQLRGLFPLVSRINHACDPNAFVMFSQSGFSVGIKAYRDIAPGEELSVSYLHLGMPSEKRQEGLRRWGFTCSCELCSLAAKEKAASDARRTRIGTAEQELLSHWKEGKHMAAIHVGKEVLKILKQENLTSMLADQYVTLARLYLARGEREVAEEYVESAVDILWNLGFLGMEGKEDWDVERLLGAFGDRNMYHAS
jgi:hypothetical protein